MLTAALVALAVLLLAAAWLVVAAAFFGEPRAPSLLDLLRSQSESGPFSPGIADTPARDTETSDFEPP